eukprot:1330299-Amorphochlora_amoeboformis.AAC.1
MCEEYAKEEKGGEGGGRGEKGGERLSMEVGGEREKVGNADLFVKWDLLALSGRHSLDDF